MNSLQQALQHASEYLATSQRGLRMLASIDAAEVEIATTPKVEVFSIGKVKLYRYSALAPRRNQTPLLIVYSQIGRYTMLDLQPDRSLVRRLLSGGVDVWIIDWGNPNRADRWVQVDDYVCDYVDACVRHMRDAAGVEQVNLLGICEGGVFAACYAALNPQFVNALVLAVTPIDFHADRDDPRPGFGQLNRWARSLPEQDAGALIDAAGMLPGEMIGALFQAMTPAATLTKYNVDLAGNLDVERDQLLNFLRMEQWLLDRPHHPAEAARQLLVNLYQRNELINGEFELDGRKVALGNLVMPVLNVFASADHIVPAATARRLADVVGTDDYEELQLQAGHIGAFVSRKSNRVLGEKLVAWLGAHERQPHAHAA